MAAHDEFEFTGMVISSAPAGDYNRRLVILTGESGRITVFARGARKPGSRFMGATEPFSFGRFKMVRGKDAYTLTEADISRHFEELRTDYEAMVYGSYFLEIAEYYTRENMEAYDEINLIYASLTAMIVGLIDRRLIRAVYEIRSLVIAGEFPGIPDDRAYSETAVYTVGRIAEAPVRQLYSFSLKGDTLEEVVHIAEYLIKDRIDRKFRSAELLL